MILKNDFRVTGDLLTIKTKRKGRNEYIHLDVRDLIYVRFFRWYINGNGYAIATFPKEMGDWNKKLLMHRLITQCPEHLHVDHINHNKLDNRRKNLRVCNRKQNQGNSRKQSNNKTGFKGVFRSPNGKFIAQAKIDLKSIHIGTFETAEEAAKAYDKVALAEWGEFAKLNFPVTAGVEITYSSWSAKKEME